MVWSGPAAAVDGTGGATQGLVTCLPDPDKPLGRRWAGLATVTCEPRTRSAAILDGTPADIGTHDLRVLTTG